MQKLIKGIIEFRKNILPGYRETFARLALGQTPDALFIGCSDSRVVPNLFASEDPGDLFVVRNVGNLIPPSSADGLSVGDKSEAAAIEFSLLNLKVSSIIICGHSECGAMQNIYYGRNHITPPHLHSWLQHGECSLQKLDDAMAIYPGEKPYNVLSKINVLEQKIHIESYPEVKKRVERGDLQIYCWWFDIATADVYSFNPLKERFVIIDDEEAERLLKDLSLRNLKRTRTSQELPHAIP